MVVTKIIPFELEVESLKRGASRMAIAASFLALAGCSTPDWVNPVNWFEDTADAPQQIEQPEEEVAKAPATSSDEDGEFPKLGDTPPVPGKTISIKDAETIEQGLKADKEKAQYTDQKLRADTAIQPLPTPKPVEAPAPAAAAPSASVASSGPLTAPATVAPVTSAPLTAPKPVSAGTAPTLAAPSQATQGGVKLMPNAAPVTTPEDAYAQRVPGGNTVVISGSGVNDVYQRQLAASAATTTTLPASTQFQSYPVQPLNNSAVAVSPIVQDTYNQPVALGYGNATGVGGAAQNVGYSSYGEPAAIIHFEVGSSRVGSGDMSKLRSIAKQYGQQGGIVKVVGHASSRTRELPLDRHKLVNLRMSQERATSVVKALINLGVPSESIAVESKSDLMPLTREAMPSDEAKNRRTEIFLVN
ncbi:OmpA family protein [Sneathiella limimaris]|uniref:OmpA family protein n=1 Tax=Sneathiella limimaris TaxID=1964213 RepID=UPI00146CC853|nr:OmpA family protein [Sneathiella limimaris]